MTYKYVYSVVSDFGADPTGTIDSTSNIQAAINAARSRGAGIPNGVVDFEGGLYKCGALDATGSATLELRGSGVGGSVLIANQAGLPMIDLTGSQSILVKGLSLYATAGSLQPSCGILMAASIAEGDSTKNTIEGVTIDGFFSSACMAMVGTADNKLDKCDFGQGRSDRPSFLHSNQPDWFITSPFKNITQGGSNCGDNTLVQVETHTGGMSLGAQQWNEYYRNAYSVRRFGGNSSTQGGGAAHMLFQGTNDNILLAGVQFWLNAPPAGPPPTGLIQVDTAATRIIGMACRDTGAYATSRFIGGGSTTGSVWL